jgi:SH3 domain protein
MPIGRLALVCLLFASAAQAQTPYITDKLQVELRRGPSTEYLILRGLDAGTRVEVLEQDSANGYSRVRVADQDLEGWILTRFLTPDPIARDRLAAAERNASAAEKRATDLEQQVAQLSAQLRSTQTDLDETRTNHDKVSTELADLRSAAANVVAIRDQNESLRQKVVDRDRQVEQLTIENGALSSRSNQNWFVIGAGVLLGGIVIGLVAPTLRRKRRSDW